MSASETPYTNLAMVIAANGHRGSLSETVFKPFANVLAMIGIERDQSPLVVLLQKQAVNNQVGNIIDKNNTSLTSGASNDEHSQEAA